MATATQPTEWLRTLPVQDAGESEQKSIGVDREKNAILGYVVAQLGPFKSPGRGEFDLEALEEIVRLGNAKKGGLRSRFTHPNLSSDGLGTFLGRSKNFRLDSSGDVPKVRADLNMSKSGFNTPNGDLAGYVMDLAEEDPGALSSSLVLTVEQKYRLNEDGTRQEGPDGERLPPLWKPKALRASDIVDTGDAVDDLLSVPIDDRARQASTFLDHEFSELDAGEMRDRMLAFVDRYLSNRYGDAAMSEDTKNQKTPPAAPVEQTSGEPKNAPPVAPAEELSTEQQIAAAVTAANKRAADISSLCALTGNSKRAKEFIDGNLSADAVGRLLLEEGASTNPPVGDDLSAGTEGEPTPGKKDPDAEYKKEYLSAQAVYERQGLSEADFIAMRRIDDGKDELKVGSANHGE